LSHVRYRRLRERHLARRANAFVDSADFERAERLTRDSMKFGVNIGRQTHNSQACFA
jgi:hypothetical protein